MDTYKIKQLLKKEEGFKLDFKLEINLELESEKKEFVKDVIAIVNTPGGRGYILFGIRDKTKEVKGIKDFPNNIEEKIQQIISTRCMPPVPVSFDLISIENKMIGVLTIFKSMQVPHQMLQNGCFYVRRGSTTATATRDEIARMLQENGMLSFEGVPCRQAAYSDLDEALLERSIGKTESSQNYLLLNALGILAQDEQRDIYYPTYGGLLLFGKMPQHFIPQGTVEVHYEGNVTSIGGNILKTLEQVEILMEKILPKAYPINGIREIVANAIIHRDYWNSHVYTDVRIEPETIIVTNPSQYDYEQKDYTTTRTNTWLYSRLLLIKTEKTHPHFGIGLENVKVLFKEQGGLTVENDFLSGIFKVTMPGPKYYQTI
ncbi:MAG: helix-turn-helix domain-containing protein [Cellulosilyticaceae bacterium]